VSTKIDTFTPNAEYYRYLRSKGWKQLHEAVIDRAKDCCERCGKHQVDEVHHLTYDRIYREELDDLQGLCARCHIFVHGISKIDPMVDSVYVRVTSRLAKYFDSSKRKFRHVRHSESSGIGSGVAEDYVVPKEIFYRSDGTPNVNRAAWLDFKDSGAFRSRIKRRPAANKIMREIAEKRKDFETNRYNECPECYEQFTSIEYTDHNQIRGILKKGRLLIENGEEWTIVRIRQTKTLGMVFSLQLDSDTRTAWRTFPHADRRLLDGELVFDSERKMWIYFRAPS
jgi:hypothetical protein